MPVRPRPAGWCVAALLLATAACGGGTAGSAPTTGPSSTAGPGSASAAPSPTASASTPAGGPKPAAVKRGKAELKGALLGLKDLPAGFEVVGSGGDDGTSISAPTKACAPLATLMDTTRLPGSTATVGVSFSAGQEGPFVDEGIDAMGTAKAAGGFVAGYRKSVQACRTVKLVVPGVGTSSLAVREISFTKLGDDTFAARFRASGGALDGFEIIQVGVSSGDVVVGMSLVGIGAGDAEDATKDAVQKVEKKLGTRSI